MKKQIFYLVLLDSGKFLNIDRRLQTEHIHEATLFISEAHALNEVQGTYSGNVVECTVTLKWGPRFEVGGSN